MDEKKLGWIGFASVSFATLMATLDSSAINVALPAISRDFHAAMKHVQWVMISYLLTACSLLLPMGRFGDLWGKNRLFKIGFFVFITCALLCSFAKTLDQLIFFRIFQGIGGAIVMSLSPAILVDSFPASERGKAMGFMGTMASIGLLSGAPISGLLTHYFSWKSVFFINIPMGLIGLIWAFKFLPKDQGTSSPLRFDFLGSFFVILSFGSLLFLFTNILSWGFHSAYTFLFAGLFLMGGILFLKWEWKNPHGVLDLSLFKDRFFLFGNLSLLLHCISLFILYFLTPFFLAEAMTYSQKEIGLIMMAIPLAFAISTPLFGAISDRIGYRILVPSGLFLIALAYFWFGKTTLASSTSEIFVKLLCVGLAGGLFQAPNNSGLMGAVLKHHLGTAAAMIATMRTFGAVIGVSLGTVIFTLRISAYNGFGTAFSVHDLPTDLFINAFRDTMWLSAVIVLLGMGVSLIRYNGRNLSQGM